MRVSTNRPDASNAVFHAAWKTVPLSAVARTTSGGTPSRTRPDYFGGAVPWVKSGELADGYIDVTEETLTPEGVASSSAKWLDPGTLLVAMYGATVGKTAILRTRATTNQAICAVIADPSKANAHFLRYQLIHDRPTLLNARYGGAQPNISQQVIRDHSLRLPPLLEQQRIAAVLSLVQRAIENEEKVIAVALELKRAALERVLGSGLSGELADETALPRGWTSERLEECCKVVSSSMPYTELLETPDSDADGAAVVMGIKVSDMNTLGNEIEIRTANVMKRLPAAEAKRRAIPPNAVVFPKRGAAIATNKKRIATTWTVLDPNLIGVEAGERIESRFLYHWFQRFDLRTITEPGPTPQLNKKNLVPLMIAYPVSKEEQRKIVHVLDTIDQATEIRGRRRQRLTELFTTLLDKLMTGQIRVDRLKLDTSEVVTT